MPQIDLTNEEILELRRFFYVAKYADAENDRLILMIGILNKLESAQRTTLQTIADEMHDYTNDSSEINIKSIHDAVERIRGWAYRLYKIEGGSCD